MNAPYEQGAASGLPLLNTKRVEKLTDVAQEFFSTCYDLERQIKAAQKARLKAVLDELDVFAPEENHEDYTPGATR